MQTIILYVSAANTLGAVRDYANAQNLTAPVLTRDVATCLRMRLFAGLDGTEAYPLTELQKIVSWQFVMNDDFDHSSSAILAAKHADITVRSVTETIAESEISYSEVAIPIPEMNTEELAAVLNTQESISNLNGELVGFDASGKAAFLLQIKGFTVRNRILPTGNPTAIPAEYLTAAQVRALCGAGLDLIFAESASESAADWHAGQREVDLFFRIRLKGDARNWTEGDAATFGWSEPLGLLVGPTGVPGADGICVYTHAAFATDAEGAGFTTNPAERTPQHKYLAFATNTKNTAQAGDFAGKWVKFIIDKAENIFIAGTYFHGSTVEAALQELGATLLGMEQLLAEI